MNSCIFCKIGAGEMAANLVYQDSSVVAFRDINPQAPVHILVIPKKHIENVTALQADDFHLVGEIHKVIQNVAQKEGLKDSGYRVVTNIGKNGGQTVPHLHYHVMGNRPMTWPPG